MSPYILIAAIIAALSLFGSGYYLGDEHATNACAAEKLEAAVDQGEAVVEQAKEDHKIEENHEVAREKVRIVYIKIKEKARANIDKNPGYAHCGLDADGLRLYNSRPNAAAPPATGVDSTVPGSAGSDGRPIEYDTRKQLGALADVLRLSSQAQIAGRLDEIGGTGAAEEMRPEDRAQELELKEYEATQQRAIQPERASLSHCQDCDEPIPVARQKATAVTRCVGCQEAFEDLKKRGML